MIKYGLTQDNLKAIIEKSKTKNDGVYTFRGVTYRVVNGFARFFASDREVVERCYGFNVVIGEYKGDAKKALKSIKLT